jgi:RNA polymerase sigma factor (sigma-70 family)
MDRMPLPRRSGSDLTVNPSLEENFVRFSPSWGYTNDKTMCDNQQLIDEYTTNGSEEAFRELVARYIDFVYSTALRLVYGDASSAEDVTQTVFISLARNAAGIKKEVKLGGWLHRHTYYVATRLVRDERRRKSRELAAVEMNELQDTSKINWVKISPLLDEAITQLGTADRTAILLRFFERRDFRSVAAVLGSNEDATRMRVNRALERLQALLTRRGVTLSTVLLGAMLTSEATQAAPLAMTATVSNAALASVVKTSGSLLTFSKFMKITKLTSGAAALLVVAITTTLVVHKTLQERSLRKSIAQLENPADGANVRLQEPPPAAPRPDESAQNSAPRNASSPESAMPIKLAQLLETKERLSAAQVEAYLSENRRSAASLLAAFRTTRDEALLEEAMQKFPNNPQVAFEAALRKEATPAERHHWLEAMKQAAPQNSLADYLSALDQFKAGQTDQAVQELLSASGKQELQDYSRQRSQDDEEAYRVAGYSVHEAKLIAAAHLLLPHLAQMRELGNYIVDLAKSYAQAGDASSAQNALQMGITMGRRFGDPSPGESLIGQLVGIAVERTTLGAMDPKAISGADGQTVEERLKQLTERRSAIQQLSHEAESLWPTLPDEDWISFNDRSKVFGEEAALRWVTSKYSQK